MNHKPKYTHKQYFKGVSLIYALIIIELIIFVKSYMFIILLVSIFILQMNNLECLAEGVKDE